MNCSLCLHDRTLCNSHIVPDFLFKQLKQKGKVFFVYSSNTSECKKFARTFSEKLLCESCESLLSKWESYAACFFGDAIPLKAVPWGRHFILSGIEYFPMKLFFMSLLWRFSITTNPWLRGCDLGVHQERLRLRLLNADPGAPWQYGCSIGAITIDGSHVPDLIVPPSVVKIDGHFCHRIVVGGFILGFFVTSHKPKASNCAVVLQEDGRFVLSRFDLHKIPFLVDMFAEVAKYRDT
jgi:hypothetical protein